MNEPTGISEVRYGGEWSEDLNTWTPMPDSGVGTYHEFLTPTALIGSDRVFVRWVIQVP